MTPYEVVIFATGKGPQGGRAWVYKRGSAVGARDRAISDYCGPHGIRVRGPMRLRSDVELGQVWWALLWLLREHHPENPS